MNKLIVAGLALSAAAVSLVTTPAVQAGPPVSGPEGFFCGFTAVTDPDPGVPPNAMTGEIHAGPAIVDPTDSDLAGGTMICEIKVGVGTHAADTAADASFPADSNGLIFGAETVWYNRAEGAETHMCTTYTTTDNVTIYFTSDSDGGRWHTDQTKACSEATSTGTQDAWDIIDGELCPEFEANHGWLPRFEGYIDRDGDVFLDVEGDGIHETEPYSSDAMEDLFYDCPVYTFTIDDPAANPDRDLSHYGSPTAPSVIDW